MMDDRVKINYTTLRGQLQTRISEVSPIGTPGVSCRFADVHAKTRKSRAEVGQNIITVDSALFKFTVAKISNSDFYSK